MQIKEQRQGAVSVLTPQGPVCGPDAGVFKATAEQVMGQTMGRFVVDLSGSPYVDSEGLEALVSLTEALAQSGRMLKLCGTCETVREVLELTELAELFEHFQDANAAVRSFL